MKQQKIKRIIYSSLSLVVFFLLLFTLVWKFLPPFFLILALILSVIGFVISIQLFRGNGNWN
jgi:hypothetical protein